MINGSRFPAESESPLQSGDVVMFLTASRPISA